MKVEGFFFVYYLYASGIYFQIINRRGFFKIPQNHFFCSRFLSLYIDANPGPMQIIPDSSPPSTRRRCRRGISRHCVPTFSTCFRQTEDNHAQKKIVFCLNYVLTAEECINRVVFKLYFITKWNNRDCTNRNDRKRLRLNAFAWLDRVTLFFKHNSWINTNYLIPFPCSFVRRYRHESII